jgi:hypothetical protein
MKSNDIPATNTQDHVNLSSSIQQSANNHFYPYLQRVLPPSQAITRENLIDIHQEKFKNLLHIQLNPAHSHFNDNIICFVQLMEKIRIAVQSNLGLSAIERETHESHQPIWVKKGKLNFPIEENGKMKDENILFDTTQSHIQKNSPKVCIIDDDTNDEGLSFLYKTKYRCFSLHIQPNGKVISSLTLNWKEIYNNLAPDNKDQQPLRSFTPWQRHSESNFFNGRSTNKILGYLTSAYPSIFKYDRKSYYKEGDSEFYSLSPEHVSSMKTNSPNLYITLNDLIITPAKKDNAILNQPILAVVRRKSPLLGNVFQLIPGLYKDEKLHLVLHGHQEETEIQKVFSCDFKNEKLHSWIWRRGTVILRSNEPQQSLKPTWKNLHLLKYGKQRDLIKHTAIAPMVRASDVVMRKFWMSSLDIPNSYSEMITIADIFNINHNQSCTSQEILENFYYSDQAASSFRRLNISEYELEQAEHYAFQIVLPHNSADDIFFWGKNGEHIARTVGIVLKVFLSMVPTQFHKKMRLAVNMCCPAASIENMGAGFGLRNKPEYIESIIQAIKKKYPTMPIEFKTLMLSNADKLVNVTASENGIHRTSFDKNKLLSETLSLFGANRLVWQGKPRNEEIYNYKTSLDITHSANVNHAFKFSYSGMIATLKDSDLLNLGYNNISKPHCSAEGVFEYIKKNHEGNLPLDFEVMLGRVLLGSSWLLRGYYASDQEIILMTLLQGLLLREFSIGSGPCGIDLMQIQLLYNVRHIINEDVRNQIMLDIFKSRSADKMIDILYEKYQSIIQKNDLDETSILKPSQLKLKSAIKSASSSQYSLFTSRETIISDHQQKKSIKLKM